MMERTTPWVEIRLEETGFGMAGDDWFTPSDQQLWYFMLLSEYLRITHDYKFLLEEVSYYPLNESPRANSIEMIERCFKYLRDDVGLGGHNLVHMRYSDWNDEGFFLFNASYVRYWTTAESYLNSAMVASIFPGFIEQLNNARDMPAFSRQKARLDTLTRSMNLYAQTVTSAFLEGLDDRNFSIRCRMDDKLIGDDFMFLEPQSFALQIPSLDPQKKAAIFHEVKSRLIDGEVMGARLCEKYLPNSFGEPMFATGLFWWAMNGPLIIGVSSFDKPAAWELLHKMTFDNHVRHFPTYWEGYWTASDALGASVMPFEGSCPSDFPAFCGHAHAWPLYCYFKLKDKKPDTCLGQQYYACRSNRLKP